ncbi:hypothetical protein LCGC14_1433300 [marine sediment metagenome]|uniref:Uncharacterized protein n=1 Tax=marine sediment metagenome TaxID=412755 RepID=A0A0F9IFD9_9ZZZZ
MKRLILGLIVFVFVLTACGGTKFSIKQCKQVADTETECMTTVIEGESDILPF